MPYTSGIVDEPGATNHTLQDVCAQDFADHLSILGDHNARQLVRNALDPEHAQPVECSLVLPIIGAIPGLPTG
ncbi:hypothetical protein [Aldersonia kunmingensis]|uniref:hypothetical protein n=1 Tax=Aldersonia kunmingensis TaxID=408066 RepID=UPI0008303187|nr:hypothetical protein [Aldersonia kunmingensis]